jgi:ribose transport system substrate-binding protein
MAALRQEVVAIRTVARPPGYSEQGSRRTEPPVTAPTLEGKPVMDTLPNPDKRSHRIAPAAAVLAALASLLLAACSSSTTSSAKSASPTPTTATVAQAKAELATLSGPVTASAYALQGATFDAQASKGKTVFYIPITLHAGFFALVQAGLTDALSHVGVNLRVCDGGATPTGISNCMAQAVAAKAGGIITDSIPYGLVPTAYQQLFSTGIPVYLAGVTAPSGVALPKNVVFGGDDAFEAAGIDVAERAVIADSGGKANILFLRIDDSSVTTDAAAESLAYLRKQCPGCSVTVENTGITDLTNLPSLVSSSLISDPQIGYVIPQADAFLAGVTTGIQTAGRVDKVKVATAAGGLGGLQQLQTDPNLIADGGDNTPFVAWTRADAVLRVMNGLVPPQYPAAVRAFTPENVKALNVTAAVSATGAWYGTPTYQSQFLRLWGVQ